MQPYDYWCARPDTLALPLWCWKCYRRPEYDAEIEALDDMLWMLRGDSHPLANHIISIMRLVTLRCGHHGFCARLKEAKRLRLDRRLKLQARLRDLKSQARWWQHQRPDKVAEMATIEAELDAPLPIYEQEPPYRELRQGYRGAWGPDGPPTLLDENEVVRIACCPQCGVWAEGDLRAGAVCACSYRHDLWRDEAFSEWQNGKGPAPIFRWMLDDD